MLWIASPSSVTLVVGHAPKGTALRIAVSKHRLSVAGGDQPAPRGMPALISCSKRPQPLLIELLRPEGSRMVGAPADLEIFAVVPNARR